MTLFHVSLVRGNASEVGESTRVNFKPCWCLFGTLNDDENVGYGTTLLLVYLTHDGPRKTTKEI